ncbi:hypothetical protein MLD38_038625 [Melastoma candidum]|uniref:Uncharacterized protein n=1 Tax=Melastoma candidum TaxID=119954 RepID=A0ACB9KZR7_9MYRT|nr:hypothetical protein MLD38_038625 [Melastoma candidum]
MESFTLLKFWRRSASPSSHPHHVTTLLASADSDDGARGGSDAKEGNDDDGPFFDLEFDISNDDEDDKGPRPVDNARASSASEGDDEREDEEGGTDGVGLGLSFVLSPCSFNDTSDDSGIFLKGDLCPVLNSEDDATSLKPAQFPVSLLKPSAKLRVLISGLKKPAAHEKSEKGRAGTEQRQSSRRLFIKFKVEEKPFSSLFTRDNSSRMQDSKPTLADQDAASSEDRGREAKMQRYLKKVKPLYIGVSKLRSSSQLRATAETQKDAHGVNNSVITTDAEARRGNDGEPGAGVKVGFRVMCRQLGKSRSASAAVAAVPRPTAAAGASRRDDSLLQQQDGIQGAILHCKRSFNESRGR